jgi:hypothetical protein
MHPAATLTLAGQIHTLFGLHGEPFLRILRTAGKLLTDEDPNGPDVRAFIELLKGRMDPENAVSIYRYATADLPPYHSVALELAEALHAQGWIFTLASRVDYRNRSQIEATIHKHGRRITFVHPHGSREWVTDGDQVIVPISPKGRILTKNQQRFICLLELRRARMVA